MVDSVVPPLLFSMYWVGAIYLLGFFKQKKYPNRSPTGREIFATAVTCLFWPLTLFVFSVLALVSANRGGDG